MVGTASPVMKKYIHKPAMWVLDNKVRTIFGKPVKLLSSVKK